MISNKFLLSKLLYYNSYKELHSLTDRVSSSRSITAGFLNFLDLRMRKGNNSSQIKEKTSPNIFNIIFCLRVWALTFFPLLFWNNSFKVKEAMKTCRMCVIELNLQED